MTRILNSLGRSRTGCSVLALATAMAFGATPAQAQFVGSIDSSAGIDTANSTNSNIIVTGNQAVINWTATDTPTGGQIVFLPDSNSVTFSSGSEFAILNRITPGTVGNSIYMGGNISSFAGDFTGGTVYFYSPNGIVIGANASINVGSLGLTTLPIADDGQGNWMTGFGGANPSVTFGQATNPNSFIRTDAALDGSIRANGAGNYVALVAPIINHAGTIRTDGGVALVAAEAASITFSDSGLYNIQVTTGSGAAQSLTVNGGTIERNSQAIGGDRHAYLVAVPKNDLTTMLITGGANLGFDIAGSAGVEGNTVVLRSGYTEVDQFGTSYFPDKHGNLTIDNAAFTSDVQTIAYGDTQISTFNGPTSFSGNLDVINDFTAFVGATTGDLTIGGKLDVHTFYLWSLFGQPTVNLWAGAGATLSTGDVELLANTQGANAPDEFTPGESVTGGTINITANDGGHILINGTLSGEANGTGGAQDYSGGVGGNGTGGTIAVKALGAGSSISAGDTDLFAFGNGGTTSECTSCNISGGIGHGGTIHVQLDQGAASMAFGALNTWAQGSGGYGAGGNGGHGIGGTSNLSIGGGSTLTVNGDYFNFADGFGGGAEGAGNAGDGHGGSAALLSTTGGGQIFFKGSNSYITADAGGGVATGSGDGGDAFTGSASINIANTAISVANAAQTQPFGQIYVKADAYGGASTGGTGGSADASTGTASISLGGSSSLTAGLQIHTLAEATAGNGVSGGTATGGTASITVNGGGTLGGGVNQIADATAGSGTSGPGGNATGGTAALLVIGGTANLTNYFAGSSATGGDSTGGAGGNATGGRTAVSANGGTLHATGNIFIDAGAIGGDGLSGGNATGLVSPPENEGAPVAAGLYVQNGGSIDADGLTVISTEAVGGNGSNGNGGNAAAGEAEAIGFFGSIDLGSLAVDTNAYGGDGGNGGNGGNANGGPVDIAFGLGAAAIGGSITLSSATITADGEGGDGGTGTSGNTGGNGGLGGAGSGGRILFTGAAANGTLISGGAIITTLGRGGAGGAGGNGDTGSGGNGGAGGTGTGGGIQTGTLSAEMAPTSGGGATFTTLSLNSSAFGGDGGDGGTGGAGTGTGGNGGAALGGGASFLARGTLVTATSVTLNANANGGDGGSGSVDGNGGNARTGTIMVESKDRFGHADQRGTLNANSIVGSAVAEGGIGTVNGTSSAIGISYFRVLNGDATIGSLDFNIDAETYDNTFASSYVSVRDGIATIAGDFSFTTPGTLVLDASLGSINAGTISLDAGSFTGTFIADNVVQTQVGPGTYTASSINVSTGGDFITNAHLVSGGSLDINAPGLINMRNATSTDGSINLTAGTTINGANLNAADFVNVSAPGNITLVNIDAGSSISAESIAGALTVTDLSAQGSIDLDAPGAILFRDVLAADDFSFDGGSTVTGRDINATSRADGEAQGAIVLRDVTVTGPQLGQDFSVGFGSATSILTRNVSGTDQVGFASAGSLTTGNLIAGSLVMTLAGGDISTGSITTTQQNGQVYMADFSMFATGGGGPGTDFDESLVLPLDPVMTGGSITIDGPVSTSLFRVASGGNFTAGDITAVGYFDDVLFVEGVNVRSGGTAILNGTWTGEEVNATSNDIDITSDGAIDAGDVALASTNSTGTIIGDGVAGTGYRLSDAEYDRINSSGGEIEIGINGSLGGALNMIIGDLSVNAASAGADEYEFAPYQTDSEEGSGSIRVVGDMVFTNMGGVEFVHDVSFTTATFELDAATGSISLTGAGTELAGELNLYASQIHVAEGSILDQLADDPQYDGYQDDLNAPATVQRPGGVLNAATIWIESDNLQNVLIQNTGTAETPAGFLAQETFINDDSEVAGPPGSIDLVVNGQLQTEGGVLTGIAVRDASVEGADLTPFTANSTINGCLLTGACTQVVEPPSPFPPTFTPTPGIQQEIVLLGDDPLPPPPFGNEDVIDDNDEETEDTSPIVPPQPLFDTSELGEAEGTGNPAFNTPMRSNPGLTKEGDVDDPVSGSGNPALMEEEPTGDEEKQP